MFTQIELMIRQKFMHKKRERKKVTALVIKGNEKFGIVILYRLNRAEERFLLCAFYVVFDEKLFALISNMIVKRITFRGAYLCAVFGLGGIVRTADGRVSACTVCEDPRFGFVPGTKRERGFFDVFNGRKIGFELRKGLCGGLKGTYLLDRGIKCQGFSNGIAVVSAEVGICRIIPRKDIFQRILFLRICAENM